ncbi:hypothetical protein HPB50_017192 [Hyalomma asiaticum]|uniref:Uncharacterized protein n=1 Tax=Hyalomma asiaticum TaxID=266040 RepID=A0ACB7TJR0_HYAAI|nr:hypothetical protein HPB50_017192 [Hyalomma asiaticum]
MAVSQADVKSTWSCLKLDTTTVVCLNAGALGRGIRQISMLSAGQNRERHILKPRKQIKANASLGLLPGPSAVATTNRLCGVDLGSCDGGIQRRVDGRIHQ